MRRKNQDSSRIELYRTIFSHIFDPVAGWSVRDIAKELHIGKTTVETHRRNIMEKLSCENLADLTRYAIREGLYNIE